MDVAGAKALRDRLGSKGKEAPPVPADSGVSEDAPPVYQWLGVSQAAPEAQPIVADEADPPRTSLFRRLGFSFR